MLTFDKTKSLLAEVGVDYTEITTSSRTVCRAIVGATAFGVTAEKRELPDARRDILRTVNHFVASRLHSALA